MNLKYFLPSNYIIPVAIAVSILLIGYNIEPAFAEIEITIITPTGGALSATSDCTDITTGNDVIWIGCNNVLYAINGLTNVVIANITATLTSSDVFLSSVSGTSVIVVDVSASVMTKYTLSGSTITTTGVYSSPSCTFPSTPIVQYDYIGFIWIACGAQDTIVRVNPITMSSTIVSQDLTDGAGVECDNPIEVVYDANDDIGGISCGTSNNIVTFTVVTASSITLLDSEAVGSSELFIDGANNRLIKYALTTITPLIYDSTTGVMTAGSAITVDTDICNTEPILANAELGQRLVCFDESGTNTIITAIISNSTTFEIFLNTIVAFADPAKVGLDFGAGSGSSPNLGTFYISSNLNNQKFIKIAGLRSIILEPEPPLGGGSSTTDTDGDGIPNNLDNDIDGDGIPNNADDDMDGDGLNNNVDTDDDGDGIPDTEDSNTGGGSGIDCSIPANANIVICRLGGDGSVGSAGDFMSEQMQGIFCSIGLVDCAENPDIKTNGIGYLLFVGAIAIMFGLFWMVTRGHIVEVPTFIWIVSILSMAGAFALFNIIDPVIFIITIVAVIALAVPKIISTVRGDTSTLGAGNTS